MKNWTKEYSPNRNNRISEAIFDLPFKDVAQTKLLNIVNSNKRWAIGGKDNNE